MKKLISVLLVLSITLSLAACSKAKQNSTVEESVDTSQSITASSDNVQDEAEQKKILVIYFSCANTTSSDIVSMATPDFDGLGSTEYLAQYIHEKVGGDIAKITPVKDYPTGYDDTADYAKKERDNDERPQFVELEVNPEDYDVIFVGYPMWWYTLPMIMYTFFDTYDFGGKTIIPFNTHEGSGDGGTYDEIREFEPDATVLDGFNVRGSSADKADKDLDEWLESLEASF